MTDMQALEEPQQSPTFSPPRLSPVMNNQSLSNSSLADIFKDNGLCVIVQPGHDRHQWKLKLSSEDKGVDAVGHAVYFPK